MPKCCCYLLLTVFFTGMVRGEAGITLAFDIRRQPITTAVSDFGLQAGTIIALGENQLTQVYANRVRGKMTLEQALEILLRGTGYGYERLPDRSIRVYRLPEAVSGEPQADSDYGEPLSEVIITAQLRAQPPLEVPIATSVFSAAQLEDLNVQAIDDIATLTPGLVASRFSYANPTFNIRGAQNTFSSVGTSEPTGVFLDEVYISRFSASNLRLYDLTQAVIARGPQGTLFGRNVTSGAIMLFTAPPKIDQRAGSLHLTAGNRQHGEVKALANLSLGASAAVKISGVRSVREGLGRDLISDREQDDLRSGSARLQLLVKPNRSTDLVFSLDHSLDKNNGRTLSSARRGDLGIRQSLLGFPQRFERTISGASLKIDTAMGNGKLTAITGFRTADSDEIFSRGDLSFTLLETGFQEIAREVELPRTLSQEIRYLSYPGEYYNFIAGLYLFFEDSERRIERSRLAAVSGHPVFKESIGQSVMTQSYAVYFDNTFTLAPEFSLTVGARFTFEEKEARINLDQRIPAVTGFARDAEASWEKLTPRIVLSWQPENESLVYASYTQGFTAGGFNTEATSLEDFSIPFDPEKSDAFEVGVKGRWLDERLITNAVLFRQRYRDKQEFVRRDVTSANTILNAAGATVDGLEVEAAWKPDEAVRLAMSYAYLNGRYDDFEVPGELSRTGNRLAGSPEHQYSLSLTQKQPFAEGRLSSTLTWAWQGRFTPSSSNTRFFPEYGLLNARINYQPAGKGFGLTLWANNLLDEEYQLATTGFAGADAAWYAPPRTFGVTLDLTFGDHRP